MGKLRGLAKITGIALLGSTLTGVGYLAGNVLDIDSKANLEQKITSSDSKQAKHLEAILIGSLEDFSNLEEMENIVPTESMFLTLAFYSYALTNMALSDSQYLPVAEKLIGKAIEKSKTPRIVEAFSFFENQLQGKYKENVLYLGHLNLMMGAYYLVSGNSEYLAEQKKISDALYNGFMSAPTHHLQTYVGDRWPADNVVGLASLNLYDQISKENHGAAIRAWKRWTLEHLDQHNLIYSHINGYTSKPDEAARGCSMAFSIPFIRMFDEPFAIELYSNFRANFFKELFGISFARESLDDNYTANVDSGPIIMGVGSVASAFSICASKATGDKETFSNLSRAAEFFTLPYETNSEKGYLANIALGESILLYCRTWRPWF